MRSSILRIWKDILPRSDILPRVKYENESKKGAGRRFTHDINKNARKTLREFSNTHIIRNSYIFNPREPALFLDDVHLSDIGQDTFRTHLSNALVFFNRFPSAFQYPEDLERHFPCRI